MHQRLSIAFMSVVALLMFAMAFAACGDDDDASPTPDPQEVAEVEEVVTAVLSTAPDASEEDLDYFFAHITEKVRTALGFPSEEECRDDLENCIGEPTAPESLQETTIDDDSASTIATAADGSVLYVGLIRDGDTWQLDGFASSAIIPAGTKVVEVTAVDYGFEWDNSEVGDGDVAFRMTNNGDESHEIAIASLEDDFDLDAAITAAENGEEELPGIAGVVAGGFGTPGSVSNVVLEEPLAPGNYLFFCMVPTEEGEPHFILGMHSEFEVTE